jgi:hypothetical protein
MPTRLFDTYGEEQTPYLQNNISAFKAKNTFGHIMSKLCYMCIVLKS